MSKLSSTGTTLRDYRMLDQVEHTAWFDKFYENRATIREMVEALRFVRPHNGHGAQGNRGTGIRGWNARN